MKKLLLFSLGVLLIGSASARDISKVQIAPKTERGIVTFSEFNALADAIDALTDIFNGTLGDLTEIVFPKPIKVPQLCIGGMCKTAWPTPPTPPWAPSGGDISRVNGNVGIGIATPSSKLHVQGNLNVSGNIIQGGSPLIPTCGEGQRIIFSGGKLACGATLDTYAWTASAYGSCECVGLQSRIVSCLKNGTETVPDSSCPELKPAETTTCTAPESCYAWAESGFGTCSCSGTSSQTVECKNGATTVADSFCTEPKPSTTGSCTAPSSCYAWNTGVYSDCSCSGSQLRTVLCQNGTTTVADSFCITA